MTCSFSDMHELYVLLVVTCTELDLPAESLIGWNKTMYSEIPNSRVT